MKKIEAVIPAFQLEVVAEALREQGVEDLVISEVLESCALRARMYRGVKYAVDYAAELKLEAVVSDQLVTCVSECIIAALQTGRFEDAKLFVTSVEVVIEIGGRERSAPTWNASPRSLSWAGKSGEARSGA